MNPWLRWWCPDPCWTPETLRGPEKKTARALAAEIFAVIAAAPRCKRRLIVSRFAITIRRNFLVFFDKSGVEQR